MKPHFIALLFVTGSLAGFALVWISKRFLSVSSWSVFLPLFFAPFLVYLIMSGHLSEFRGVGFEARFKTAVNDPIKTAPLKAAIPKALIAPDEDRMRLMAFVGEGSEAFLLKSSDGLGDAKTSAKALLYGKNIYDSLLEGRMEVLVIVDGDDRVVGYYDRNHFLDLLRIEFEQLNETGLTQEQINEPVIKKLKNTNLWHIVAFPVKRCSSDEALCKKVTALENESYLTVLELMQKEGLRTVVVADRQHRYKGLVRRNDIMDELLVSVFSGNSRTEPAKAENRISGER